MRRTIPIDQLTIGMSVVGLDISWLKSPFLRHQMRITRHDQIGKLKQAGVRYVDVEGTDLPVASDTDDLKPAAGVIAAAAQEPSESSPPQADELAVAKQVYRRARQVVVQAMQDARTGEAIKTEEVSAVVSGMVENILQNQDALVSLTRLKSFDEYTFFHSVNTAVLALALGRRAGMDRQALHRLGCGALLHDIGKTKIPLEILNKPGKYEAWEFEIMKQHALRGVEILSKVRDFQDDVVRPALEHHERVDGTGYPFGRDRSELTIFGMIASVVDIYDALTSDRCYHQGIPAHRALQRLYDLGQSGHLDAVLVQRFIQSVGVYPVGSCVQLNTGEVAIVKEVNHVRPVNPVIILVRDSNLQQTAPMHFDLSRQVGKPVRKIVAVLDAKEAGVDSSAYLEIGSSS